MNYELTFVTCFYDDLFQTEFGGRPHPRRKYLYGIESALKMNSPYVIFTWEKNINYLENYFKEILGVENYENQIKIIPYNLYETSIRDIIKKEKEKPININISGDRSHDIMFGKFLMLKKAITENFFNSKFFFWIDAGLSSSDLFPNKYLQKDSGEKQWSLCKLFTYKVVDNLINLSKEKILLFKLNTVGHWINSSHLPVSSLPLNSYIIGGIFGGVKEEVDKFCDVILNSFLFHIDEYSTLYFEEVIMTIVYEFNKNQFNTEEFEIWHHEDSGDWVQPFIMDKKNFYKIFENFNK